jgi:hypothetical protein
MPRLVKGGKHTYGWCRVGENGRILLPPEATGEYGFMDPMKLFMLPGSKKSGGFSVGSLDSISLSPIAAVLDAFPELAKFQLPEGATVEYHGRWFCWIELRDGAIQVPPETLQHYSVQIGDELLAIRGSNLAVGFAVRGPIVEEAKKHPDLMLFESSS